MKAPGTAYDDPQLGKDPQPATMAGYVETTDDNGGVHINSGIPNHAFYLAATAIGGNAWEGAGQVWFDVLTGGRLDGDCRLRDVRAAHRRPRQRRYAAGSAEAPPSGPPGSRSGCAVTADLAPSAPPDRRRPARDRHAAGRPRGGAIQAAGAGRVLDAPGGGHGRGSCRRLSPRRAVASAAGRDPGPGPPDGWSPAARAAPWPRRAAGRGRRGWRSLLADDRLQQLAAGAAGRTHPRRLHLPRGLPPGR